MQVITLHDPLEYLALAEQVVEAEPILHSVTISVARALVANPALYPTSTFHVVPRPGRLPFLAHHTPPYPFHLPAEDAAAASALADHVHAAGGRPTGANGHRRSAEAFAERWHTLTGQRSRVAMGLGLYDLPEAAVLPFAVPGLARPARPDELALVDGWQDDFTREALGREPNPEATFADAVRDGRLMLWCDPEPVAMAAATASAGGVTRIGPVWTPPAHRRRGYGSAVTAALSRDRQQRGLRCMLYTDLANPTSNGIYRAMGYRHLGDTVDLAFLA